jgi:hypothetical protein
MTDRHAQEGPNIPDVETMTAWAKEERRNPTPPSEDDELKEALRLQNFADKFVQPDPTDHLSDDELWELMPESIRKSGA